MNKVFLVNGGSKSFGQKFRERCINIGLDCVSVRGVHVSFFVKDGKVEVWNKGEKLFFDDVGYVFVRVRGRVSHTISLFLQTLSYFGVKHNDKSIIEHTESVEKITQMIKLSLGGVSVPETFLFNRYSFKYNKEIIKSWINYPCVLKTGGSKGEMVWKIESFEELMEKKKGLKKETMMVQKFIPNEFDIRVLYMYGEVLGAIKRSSADDFYNNIAKGGESEKIDITEEEERLAKKSCKVLRVDFGGVDIVRTSEGPLVFEVNTGPQIYGFEKTTDINVSRELVDRIKKHFFN